MKSLVMLILISICTSIASAQYKWENGEISTKQGNYVVKIDNSKSISFNKKYNDPRSDLEFGYSLEKGKVEVTIVSALEYVNVIREAVSSEKLEKMAKIEKQFSLGLTLDEEGIPFYVNFYLNPNTLLTPDELIYIETELIKRVRYVIRREMPFGQPCVYPAGGTIKFQDILNGEIPGLKRSEQLGKEKPEWER